MKYCTIDKSKEGIAVIKINPVDLGPKEIKEFISVITQLTEENRVWVVDLRDGKFLPAEARIAIGKWYKEQNENIKKGVVGIYYIVTSLVPELILKGIFLVAGPPVPYQIGSKYDKGIAWAEEMCMERV